MMRLKFAVALTGLLSCLSISADAVASTACMPADDARSPVSSLAHTQLPTRSGLQVKTSGRVPHVQVNVEPDHKLNSKLLRFAYNLPDVEERPTIVSLPGAKGMWLTDNVSVVHPKAIVSGREFAHIHPDGSLHAPLPYERALEVEQKGWGERHPWADRRDGWEGLVMLYSATDKDQLKVLVQLVTESYNFVTGLSAAVPEC